MERNRTSQYVSASMRICCVHVSWLHYDKTAQGFSSILALAKNISSTGHISLMWNSMIQHYLTKPPKKNYGNCGLSHMLLSYFMWAFGFFSSFLHLSCIFIVNLINRKMFWSCKCILGWLSRQQCGRVCLHLAVPLQSLHTKTVYNISPFCFTKPCVRYFQVRMCWKPMVWKITCSGASQVLMQPDQGGATYIDLMCLLFLFGQHPKYCLVWAGIMNRMNPQLNLYQWVKEKKQASNFNVWLVTSDTWHSLCTLLYVCFSVPLCMQT